MESESSTPQIQNHGTMNRKNLLLSLVSILIFRILASPANALPPPEDLPEEILRTEIITEARSPIDGRPLSAAEYAQQQAEFAESPYPPQLASEVRHNIFLLQILNLFRQITPF